MPTKNIRMHFLFCIQIINVLKDLNFSHQNT